MGVEDGCWGWVHFKTRIFLPSNVRSSCVIVKTSTNWSLFFGNDISWAFVVSMGFCSVLFSGQDLLMSAIVLFHRSHSAAMGDPRISISQESEGVTQPAYRTWGCLGKTSAPSWLTCSPWWGHETWQRDQMESLDRFKVRWSIQGLIKWPKFHAALSHIITFPNFDRYVRGQFAVYRMPVWQSHGVPQISWNQEWEISSRTCQRTLATYRECSLRHSCHSSCSICIYIEVCTHMIRDKAVCVTVTYMYTCIYIYEYMIIWGIYMCLPPKCLK